MLDAPAQVPEVHESLVEHELARSIAWASGGWQAKVAAAVTMFSVITGMIGMIVDVPQVVKMITSD